MKDLDQMKPANHNFDSPMTQIDITRDENFTDNGLNRRSPQPTKRIPYTYPYTEQELIECRDPILVGERGDFDPFKGMGPEERREAEARRKIEID